MTDSNQFENILVQVEGGVARLTINRPEALNALNPAVIAELERALLHDIDTGKVRVVVIEGSGDKAFVAGADIAEMGKMAPDEARSFARAGQLLTKTIESLECAVVAKVKGFALGGGCELAMACDMIVAGESAKFGQPEVNLGLIPGFGGTQRLVRRVGLPVAMDMLLTGRGRTLTAKEAQAAGLVSRVVADDKLEEEVGAVIKALLKTGPRAVAETKRLAREAYNMTLDAGLNAEAHAFVGCFTSGEAEEGIGAFLDKRRPSF